MARFAKPSRAGVKSLTPEQLAAVRKTAADLAFVVTQQIPIEREAYLRELTAVARAAVVAGEYREALRGYEILGEALGHLAAGAKHQHLHMHAATPAALCHASDAELAALLQQRIAQPTAAVVDVSA